MAGAPRIARAGLAGLPALAAIALATLLGASPAAAAPPEGTVRSVRRDLVYVDLGRVHGVRAGDVLTVAGSPVRLEVVTLGERQLVAKRVGPGDLALGARVVGAREAGEAAAKRPVHPLPPVRPAAALPWAGAPPGRAALVPAPGTKAASGPPSGVSGELRLGYAGVFDAGQANLDLHQMELRSKLAVDGLADGRLDYRHDVAARAELGPDLADRGGADSRPYYRIRELRLRWRDGPLDAAIGRFAVADAPAAGLIDGARVDLALGRGFAAGVHGGLAPALLDTGVAADAGVVGAHASWTATEDDWRAQAALLMATSFWRGAFDRLDVGGRAAFAWGRDLDVYATAIGTLVDPALVAGGQPSFSLSRAYFGARVRPLTWLTVDAHIAEDRMVADAEAVSALGADALVTLPRASTWLQVRFDPTAQLAIALSGTLGFGSTDAEQQGGAARVTLHDALPDLRVGAGYRVTQTPVLQAHAADLDLGWSVARTLELALGYTFTTFHMRLLDERQDEHRVEVGADLMLAGPWRAHVSAAYAFGHLPGQILVLGQLGWRFK